MRHREIKAQITTGDIQACVACDAINYDPEPPEPSHGRRVEHIYDVTVGPFTLHLCEDCIDRLVDTLEGTRAERCKSVAE